MFNKTLLDFENYMKKYGHRRGREENQPNLANMPMFYIANDDYLPPLWTIISLYAHPAPYKLNSEKRWNKNYFKLRSFKHAMSDLSHLSDRRCAALLGESPRELESELDPIWVRYKNAGPDSRSKRMQSLCDTYLRSVFIIFSPVFNPNRPRKYERFLYSYQQSISTF